MTKLPTGTIHAFPNSSIRQFVDSSIRLPAMTAPTPTPLSRLYARPGFLLRRAHQISSAVFESECKAVGLTPAQFGVLTVLQSSPGLDQSSLARALGFDKVTVLRVLRGLEARGLVARTAAPNSRRNLAVALSADGEALLKQSQKPAEHAYKRLLSPLNAEQQIHLLALLQQLTDGLEDHARAAFVPPGQASK